ncbi:hypothetical protein PCANC_05235 [Puccinia coronata f. sp. avenae]|uniref:Uncharacterized protein n=1 Tax=Puccinia coronata f. sp. avenae TaxID=200324 RepID=A0A2N5VWB9_9BASI|nr:hypothetical protein PCANC_05235 [Puccinia coronata f. sp. avenae]
MMKETQRTQQSRKLDLISHSSVMRAISSLLIIVAQLAIIGCVWHSDDLMDDGWGGEDNRQLLERIPSFTSPSFPQSSSWHTNEPTPNYATLESQDHFNRQDSLPVPVTDPHNTDSSPMQPTFSRHAASSSTRKNKMPHDPHSELSPVHDHIQMREMELDVYPLRFDRGVFLHRDGQPNLNFPDRMKVIEAMIKQHHAGRSHSDAPALALTTEEMHEYLGDFHNKDFPTLDPKRRPSVVAEKEMNEFYFTSPSAGIWETVYKQRLGIDFKQTETWFKQTVTNYRPSSGRDWIAVWTDKLTKCFFGYIFYVDMFLTILPPSNKMAARRSQSFHRAVACFEEYTKFFVQEVEFTEDISKKHNYISWRYLSFWIREDKNFRSDSRRALLLQDSDREVTKQWKAHFNFICAYSIATLTERNNKLLSASRRK